MSRSRGKTKPAAGEVAEPCCRSCGAAQPLEESVPPPRFTEDGKRLATVLYATRWSKSRYPDAPGPRKTPMVRLRGDWLADAGFAEGRRFEVAVADGKLVLRAI